MFCFSEDSLGWRFPGNLSFLYAGLSTGLPGDPQDKAGQLPRKHMLPKTEAAVFKGDLTSCLPYTTGHTDETLSSEGGDYTRAH